jgi:hypothetical protein
MNILTLNPQNNNKSKNKKLVYFIVKIIYYWESISDQSS